MAKAKKRRVTHHHASITDSPIIQLGIVFIILAALVLMAYVGTLYT